MTPPPHPKWLTDKYLWWSGFSAQTNKNGCIQNMFQCLKIKNLQYKFLMIFCFFSNCEGWRVGRDPNWKIPTRFFFKPSLIVQSFLFLFIMSCCSMMLWNMHPIQNDVFSSNSGIFLTHPGNSHPKRSNNFFLDGSYSTPDGSKRSRNCYGKMKIHLWAK